LLVVWSFLRWKPSRVSIDGLSMSPTLAPGDWALVVTPRVFRRGDVAVVEHPERTGYEIVKRITAVPGAAVGQRRLGPDEWWVQGDHDASSTDSRHFGPVAGRQLKAKVVLVYQPADRRRIVR
jgi:nickel-type superoxide dismutase maturation protease